MQDQNHRRVLIIEFIEVVLHGAELSILIFKTSIAIIRSEKIKLLAALGAFITFF